VKAVRIHEDGGPEVLRYEDVPDPEPAPDEVVVRLRTASVNHIDVWLRKGLPSVPKPRIIGADGAGVVEALGPGVDGPRVGEQVVINPAREHDSQFTVLGEHRNGTYAELVAVPAECVYPLAEGLDFETAAAFPMVFVTAYRMLVTKAALREGEWVLIWGIGSGVSTAALAISRALGARTIVTSSSAAKLERARDLGADAAVPTAEAASHVKEITDGRGVHVVVEHVGKDTWTTSLALARPGGRIAVCGATSGPNPPAALHRLWWKQLTVYGSTMGSQEDFRAVYELVRSGRARPVVDRVYPLREVSAAHERLEAAEQLGKIVLRISD
jgi:NADPH:quinone reductase-like Zn-dependent oxidoreductase